MKEQLKGVIGVIERDGKYLFGLESKNSPIQWKWRLLGGKLEHGENSEQAMIRECREEAGISIIVDGFLGSTKGNIEDVVIDVCYGRYLSGELNPKIDEVGGLKWMDGYDFRSADIEPLSRQMLNLYIAMAAKNPLARREPDKPDSIRNRHYCGPYMGCDAGAIG